MAKNIYIRDVPEDLYRLLKKIKKAMECKGWVTFLYATVPILKKELEETKGIVIE